MHDDHGNMSAHDSRTAGPRGVESRADQAERLIGKLSKLHATHTRSKLMDRLLLAYLGMLNKGRQ
jgi:hypothetical protein